GARVDPNVFRLFRGWPRGPQSGSGRAAARAQIARGERIFNTRQFIIRDVPGLNDVLKQDRIVATCSTCHNTPSVGSRSAPGLMNIGVETLFRRRPEDPLYTFRNKATGEEVNLRDPGQALITGRWADMGKFKVPALRNLAARPPYFHDGSAATLMDVVDFYYDRFDIEAGPAEKEDLAAFLRAL
ncbi:MAG TPA: hypothetical protein VFU47_11760, partial [Armatimonadota bacterium]|nr:hypothetical protein [Armatimonadota bacterium]